MRRLVSFVTAVALLGSTFAATTADARPGYRKGAPVARYHGRRRGNAAAGAAVAGIAGALIGGAIAAQNRRRYYDDPGYGYYGGPAYGYYAPGPYRGYYDY